MLTDEQAALVENWRTLSPAITAATASETIIRQLLGDMQAHIAEQAATITALQAQVAALQDYIVEGDKEQARANLGERHD